jgi:cytochrome c-type biogenesis protein CcmH/NrfG
MLRDLWRVRKRQISVLILGAAVLLWAAVLVRQATAARVQRHIDAGMEFVRKRQPREAEREWQAAVKLSPNNAGVWELLSELYIENEQWSSGMFALKQVLRLAPDRPYLYSRMAACALRMSQELEAQRLAQEELKRNPNDEASLTILAFLSNMQDNTEQQIGYLQRLLVRSSDNPETLHALAQAYREAGKYAQALPVADRLVTLRPADGYGYAMRGAARFEVDASPAGLTQSETDLKKALAIEPDFAFARFALGRVYLREGHYPEAITQLEQAEQLYPDKMDVPFELATAYARAGQTAKAAEARRRFEALRQEATQVDVLQKQCALDKNNFDGFLHLGKIMLRNQDYRQAYYYLQHAVVLNPKSAEAKAAYQQLAAQLQNETAPAPH